MKQTNLLVLIIIMSIPSLAIARNPIRTLYTSDKVIKPIFLSLGRSTLLKFKEKPEKIVIGNKNYHNLEYINNDVTVQPLAAFDTNLFVYTKNKRTYSFLLKVVPKDKYDDVVHVRWKSSFKPYRINKQVKPKLRFPSKVLNFNNAVQVIVKGLYKTHIKSSYVIHLKLNNMSHSRVDMKDVKIYLTRSGKKISFQKSFFLQDSIASKQSTKARILFSLKNIKGVTLNIEFKGKKRKTIISRKYL